MNKNIKHFIFFFLPLLLPIYLFLGYGKNKRDNDPKYNIRVIIQTGPEKQALKSSYLAELMGLSIDKSSNIFRFDTKEAEKKLQSCPLIEKAKVKRYPPNAIYVDYKVRKPIAWLYDLVNFALDKKGFLFPVSPFFSLKDMPEIYLGDKGIVKDENFLKGPLRNEKLALALQIFEVLNKFKDLSFSLKRIDVSNAFSQSFGKKEIVIELEHTCLVPFKERKAAYIFPRVIRLCVKDFEPQLANYFSLNESMMKDYRKQLVIAEDPPPVIRFAKKAVDMRILKLAFIDE